MCLPTHMVLHIHGSSKFEEFIFGFILFLWQLFLKQRVNSILPSVI
ncbi:hypothetical protein MtrunA17_Chr3g0092541 [Medicago truncatula]|uniref:Uncharacterized protein n=1 Tax=Medicago truncatula TaxID=3880 RepID=A0A396IRJ8_MEDTR|nr:hypothetical protein MtrunA17_Chr3g0092541 [Medicago truncatula]